MAKDKGTVSTETKKVDPSKKPNWFVRFGRGFVRFFKRIWQAILNTVAELKKVTWPSKQDLINYTTIVVVFMVLMAVVIGLLDLGSSKLVQLLIRG